MKKKLTIIFGGSIDLYLKQMKTFGVIEKLNNWKFKRIAPEKLVGIIEGVKVEIRFCWNPVRDKNYEKFKKWIQKELKDIVAPPASELVKTIKKTDAVLFLGLCGAFKGKRNDVYLPNEFKEILFTDSLIKKEHVLKIRPKNLIKTINILIGKVSGKVSRALTSNLTLIDANAENKSKEIISRLGKNLRKYGDFVEKESYQIAKKFKGKLPLGFMVITSDVVSVKKHQMNLKKFCPEKDVKIIGWHFGEAIKAMINELK